MVGKIFLLVAILRALDAYPRPGFWAALYAVYGFVSSAMFAMAGGPSLSALLGWMVLDFVLTYA